MTKTFHLPVTSTNANMIARVLLQAAHAYQVKNPELIVPSQRALRHERESAKAISDYYEALLNAGINANKCYEDVAAFEQYPMEYKGDNPAELDGMNCEIHDGLNTTVEISVAQWIRTLLLDYRLRSIVQDEPEVVNGVSYFLPIPNAHWTGLGHLTSVFAIGSVIITAICTKEPTAAQEDDQGYLEEEVLVVWRDISSDALHTFPATGKQFRDGLYGPEHAHAFEESGFSLAYLEGFFANQEGVA